MDSRDTYRIVRVVPEKDNVEKGGCHSRKSGKNNNPSDLELGPVIALRGVREYLGQVPACPTHWIALDANQGQLSNTHLLGTPIA